MSLFEVAILENPTKKEAEDGKGERIILAPTPVVAADRNLASVAARILAEPESS